MVILDCRKYDRFATSHIICAESLEKLSNHRTTSGCLLQTAGAPLFSNTRAALTELVAHMSDIHINKRFILYDESSTALKDCAVWILPLVEHLLTLNNDVSLLRGGFSAFSSQYPKLCTHEDALCLGHSPCSVGADMHDSNSLPVQSPSQPLFNKKLGGCFDKPIIPRAASLVVVSPDHSGPDFCTFLPSAILSHVFLGSEFDAKDIHFLTSHNITHVLNVTTHIPCFYENRGLLYKRLPACDTDSDNIKQYFDEGSDFIDEAERKGGKVLVHCQAGISRSPSIVLAYLIGRRHMAFGEAYQLIAQLRPIIAPNFNFLAQLNEFEMECASSRRNSSEICSGSSDFDDSDPCNNSSGHHGESN